MRLLRVLDLGRVDAGAGRHLVSAVEGRGLGAGGIDGLRAQVHRVGTHVGDEAALVELLGHAHRGVGAEVQLAAGLLLQRGGAEGGVRATGVGLGLNGGDAEGRSRQGGRQGAGVGLGERHHVLLLELTVGVEVGARGDLRAVQPDQAGGELRPGAGQVGVHVPVGGAGEGHALLLTVDDQAHRDRLDASGRQLRLDLLPQHRRHLEAVEAVEDAAGLLRVDQVEVELAGVVDRLGDRLLGDLVEDHALGGHLGLELAQEVPGDGLPLAVTVGGEQQFVALGEVGLELAHRGALLGVDDVERLEVVLDVDTGAGPLLALVLRGDLRGIARQVTDVAATGLDDVVRTEVPGDLGRLGR